MATRNARTSRPIESAAAPAYWRFATEHPDASHVLFTVPGTNTVANPLPADRHPGTAPGLAVQAAGGTKLPVGLPLAGASES